MAINHECKKVNKKCCAVRYSQLLLILLVFSVPFSANAQHEEKKDSTGLISKGFLLPVYKYAEKTIFQYLDKKNTQKEQKAFEPSIIGGPYYTNETKVGLGIIGSGLFRLHGCENDSLPSSVALFINGTTSGAYAVGIQSNIYFKGMKSFISTNINFSDTPSHYWGIGYDAGRNADYVKYNLQQMQLVVNYSYKVAKDLSVAATFNARDMRGKYVKDISILDGENRKITAMGFGGNISYDSRDVITDPFRGKYIYLGDTFFPKGLGNTPSINSLNFIFRYYKQVVPGTVIAFDFDSNLNFGNVPWALMALSGGANQMRGYYTGRYRDRNLIDTQVEIRQHVYKRSGVVAWIGAGNVFSAFDKIKMKQTLPTYGLGYRFRVKPRTNLRFDYGFGKNTSAFYININEAF